MTAPRVSVVMPVLRPHPRHFREAVESIRAQSFSDWELIVVEAPSEISAAPLLPIDPRIRHLLEPQPTSLVAQRNRGLREARAGLVAMLDADDVARPDRLALQLAFFEAHPEVAVAGGQLDIIDGDSAKMGSRRYPTDHDAILRALPLRNPLAQSAVMLRSDAVLTAGGYSFSVDDTGEDYELWSRLARSGHRFANLEQTLVAYRIHGGATKATRLRAHLRSTLRVKELWWKDALGARGRAQMLAERALLLMPTALVLRVFRLLSYRRPR